MCLRNLDIAQSLEPYTASHTVWCGTVPDYTLHEARTILSDHSPAEPPHASALSGYKIDECDGFDCWLWARCCRLSFRPDR